MIALIAKELRYYASQRKFRRTQLIIIGLLSLVLLFAAFELFSYAQTGAPIDVGYGIYSILVIAFFIVLLSLVVPLQAMEAVQIENVGDNLDILNLTPLSIYRRLTVKLVASIITALWSISLTTPLFGLSIYCGGLTINQLSKCLLVYIACISLFSMIGMCFALAANSIQARARSFSTVLLITFLPLISSAVLPLDANLLNLLNPLSPLSVLLSIIGRHSNAFIMGSPLWIWMVCVYMAASTFLLWLATKRHVSAA